LQDTGVHLHLGKEQTTDDIVDHNFDDIVLATGVEPRLLSIEGVELPHVLGYLDVLRDHREVGKRVAVIGAGGIGFDVSEYLTTTASPTLHNDEWHKIWGIDQTYAERGALMAQPLAEPSPRKVYLMQRKDTKVGAGLGKTSGWVHRNTLKKKGVKMLNSVTYKRIVPEGIEIERDGKVELLAVDNVVVCAGQVSFKPLHEALLSKGQQVHVIGGADVAAELDAKRAIRQGAELAAAI